MFFIVTFDFFGRILGLIFLLAILFGAYVEVVGRVRVSYA